MSTQTDLTVRKSVSVNCSPSDAFALFTERLETWWPFETHCPGSEPPEEFVFEGHEGGRVFHRVAGGTEYEWATVVEWEPPSRFVANWHVTPGQPTTELEMRLVPDGGGTRVELEHRGWERYGDDAAEEYASYNRGWEPVLARYVAKVG